VHDIKRSGKRQVVGVLKSTVRCAVSVTRKMKMFFFSFGNLEPRSNQLYIYTNIHDDARIYIACASISNRIDPL
jgi:hypothetical protein